MNPTKLCLFLSTLTLAGVSHAAGLASATERPAEAAAPVLLAAAADPSIPLVHLGTVAAHAESAGVAEALPDVPSATLMVAHALALPIRTQVSVPERTRRSPVAAETLPAGPSAGTLLQASPLRGAARLVGAEKFNTDDGSSLDAFAICYRLNKRSSLQVIPGDPAPVKMPVTTMANNMGVTVGMVMRLSRQR